jgi:Na+/melibiose symporter-like transporter
MGFFEEYLIGPKLLYFFAGIPFKIFEKLRPVYFEKVLGIENERYGTLAMFISLSGMISPMLWTTLADKTRRHKLILLSVLMLNCITLWGFFPLTKETAGVFYIAAVLIMSNRLSLGGFFPLLTAQILIILEKVYTSPERAKAKYGKQRLWAAVAAIVTVNLASQLYKIHYTLMFYFMGIATALAVGACIWLIPNVSAAERKEFFEKEKQKKKEELEAGGSKPKNALLVLFHNGEVVCLLLLGLAQGFGLGCTLHFLSSFTVNYINPDIQFLGYQGTMGNIAEIVGFFFMKKLLFRVGVHWLLIVAQLSMTWRMGFYAFIEPHIPDMIYPSLVVEFFRGISGSLIQVCAIKMVTDAVPEGYDASAIGLFQAIYMGLGPAIAGFVGGYCNKEGRQLIFQVSFSIELFAFVCLFIKFAFVDRRLSLGSA